MITVAYCRTMAAYNCWQNDGLRKIVTGMNPDVLTRNQGAFFGSILGTLNHLLWGDQIWLSRFTGSAAPKGGIKETVDLTPTLAAWGAERFQTDAALVQWGEKMRALDLVGDLSWYSGAAGRDVSKPRAMLVAHVFNHQTHHRGQIHAMLTAAGQFPGDTDIPFMPEEGTWR